MENKQDMLKNAEELVKNEQIKRLAAYGERLNDLKNKKEEQ